MSRHRIIQKRRRHGDLKLRTVIRQAQYRLHSCIQDGEVPVGRGPSVRLHWHGLTDRLQPNVLRAQFVQQRRLGRGVILKKLIVPLRRLE